MYAGLSSPAGSKEAQEIFQGLKDGPRDEHSSTANSQQDAEVETRETEVVMPGGDETLQPDGAESQPPERQNTSGQLVDSGGPLCPPLNPFMIPLKLLMRK